MLINGFSNTELQEVLDELYLDDAVDIVEEMPASVVIRILDRATPEMRKSINEILKYPEDSAGSIMNMEFLSLKKDMTVEDAFKRIRRIGGDMETINILYVTDPTRRLLGVLSVRDLLLAEEDDLIEDIMDPDVVWAKHHGRQGGRRAGPEQVRLPRPARRRSWSTGWSASSPSTTQWTSSRRRPRRTSRRWPLCSPPTSPISRPASSPRGEARLPWLMILMLSATFTGMILNHYESALAACHRAQRLYPHALRHRRQLRYAGHRRGHPCAEVWTRWTFPTS